METKIIKGNINFINECEDALENSLLGKKYFSEVGSARKTLEEGFGKGEIYVAVDSDNNCKGFVWVILDGIFHSWPYIHIITVKSEYRGQGIGKMLLKFVEDVVFKDYKKLFLVVSDFNPDARRLYESIGYTPIGEIPDLYTKGITECLMMKLK